MLRWQTEKSCWPKSWWCIGQWDLIATWPLRALFLLSNHFFFSSLLIVTSRWTCLTVRYFLRVLPLSSVSLCFSFFLSCQTAMLSILRERFRLHARLSRIGRPKFKMKCWGWCDDTPTTQLSSWILSCLFQYITYGRLVQDYWLKKNILLSFFPGFVFWDSSRASAQSTVMSDNHEHS